MRSVNAEVGLRMGSQQLVRVQPNPRSTKNALRKTEKVLISEVDQVLNTGWPVDSDRHHLRFAHSKKWQSPVQ